MCVVFQTSVIVALTGIGCASWVQTASLSLYAICRYIYIYVLYNIQIYIYIYIYICLCIGMVKWRAIIWNFGGRLPKTTEKPTKNCIHINNIADNNNNSNNINKSNNKKRLYFTGGPLSTLLHDDSTWRNGTTMGLFSVDLPVCEWSRLQQMISFCVFFSRLVFVSLDYFVISISCFRVTINMFGLWLNY